MDMVVNAMPSYFHVRCRSATMAFVPRPHLAPGQPEDLRADLPPASTRSQVILVSGEAGQRRSCRVAAAAAAPIRPGPGSTESGTVARGATEKYASRRRSWPKGSLQASTMTGTSDADLYVRVGSRADQDDSTTAAPTRPARNETCTVNLPADAKIYVNVRGYASSSDFSLVGSKE
jgi:hypothetical protein